MVENAWEKSRRLGRGWATCTDHAGLVRPGARVTDTWQDSSEVHVEGQDHRSCLDGLGQLPSMLSGRRRKSEEMRQSS